MHEPCPSIDVVVVSYNSVDRLRDCIAPLLGEPEIEVIVVDNDSSDGSLESIADLPATKLQSGRNGGFSAGCNLGIAQGSGSYVLLLNPDARISPSDVRGLAAVLSANAGIGAVGPRILSPTGDLDWSVRRFPSLARTISVALFLHRVRPRAKWSDEVVRDRLAYQQPHDVAWLSGACLMLRRRDLEALEGLDEGYFLYSEDMDLCRRVWDAGLRVRFEPSATCRHEGGASAPRGTLLPTLAKSRLRYARVHDGAMSEIGQRVGVALHSALRALLTTGEVRRGHIGALRVALLE